VETWSTDTATQMCMQLDTDDRSEGEGIRFAKARRSVIVWLNETCLFSPATTLGWRLHEEREESVQTSNLGNFWTSMVLDFFKVALSPAMYLGGRESLIKYQFLHPVTSRRALT